MLQAEILPYPGNQWARYCFQCAKIEPLACFDGAKRSCRQALNKRKARPGPSSRGGNNTNTPAAAVHPGAVHPAALPQPMPAKSCPAAAAAAAAAASVALPSAAAAAGMALPTTEEWLRLQVQQQAQLLQQQQALLARLEREKQIAAMAQELSTAQQVHDQLSSMLKRSQAQKRAGVAGGAAAAVLPEGLAAMPGAAVVHQQQQQLDGCSSRTPSPTSSETDEAPRSPAERYTEQQQQQRQQPAEDEEFSTFLESILQQEMAQQLAQDMQQQQQEASLASTSTQHAPAAPGAPAFRSYSAGCMPVVQEAPVPTAVAARTFSAGPSLSSVSTVGSDVVASVVYQSQAAQIEALDSMLQQMQARVRALAAPQAQAMLKPATHLPAAGLMIPHSMA